MSLYLRDLSLRSIALTEKRLVALHTLLQDIVQNANQGLPENDQQGLVFAYLIRADNKGYVLYDFDSLLGYFREARNVQRILIVVNTISNAALPFLGPLRVPFDGHGKCIFVHFMHDEITHPVPLDFQPQIVPQISGLTVTDDIRGWTEATFARVKEELDSYKSATNYFVRTPFFPIVIRTLFWILSFSLALIAALNLSKFFSGQEAPTLLFLLLIMAFSSACVPLQNSMIRSMNHWWPNVEFRNREMSWITQGIVLAVILGIAGMLIKYLYLAVTSAIQPYLSELGRGLLK